jgi:hypothetical protein
MMIEQEMTALAPADVPQLPGWVTFSDAAALLGMTRQNVYLIAFGAGQQLGIVYKVGHGPRPVYVVAEAAVTSLKLERDRRQFADKNCA